MANKLLDYTDDPEPRQRLLVQRVSAALDTEVQFFATHRVVEAHAWAKGVRGELVCSYTHHRAQNLTGH